MVTIDHLSFGYGSKKRLFDDLSLELNPGHVYGLLGKNGAGKSTLLKNIVGLVRPERGHARVNGRDSFRRAVPTLQHLFFIPEDIYLPDIAIAQYVRQSGAFFPDFDYKAFLHYADMLDITPEGKIGDQSFGQQKKLLIAFGLATNTELLAMDEPTNGLDIPSKIQFRKLIASVQSEARTIVISTHQVRDLDNLIDTLLLLHDRKVLFQHAMETIGLRLVFGQFRDTDGMPVIYQEENMQGFRAILRNNTGAFGKVDLELLFNAATAGSGETLREILNAPAI